MQLSLAQLSPSLFSFHFAKLSPKPQPQLGAELVIFSNKLGLSWAKLSPSWGLKLKLKFEVELKFEIEV